MLREKGLWGFVWTTIDDDQFLSFERGRLGRIGQDARIVGEAGQALNADDEG
jgi:hypothetical protein